MILEQALKSASDKEQLVIRETLQRVEAINQLIEHRVTDKLISFVQDKSIFRASNFGNFFYYDFLPVAGSIAVGVLLTVATGGAASAGMLGVAIARSVLLRGGLGLLATGVGGLVGGEAVKETQYGLSDLDEEINTGKLNHSNRSLLGAWVQGTEIAGKQISALNLASNYSTQIAMSSIGSGTSQLAGKGIGVGLGYILNKLGGAKVTNYLFPTFSQGIRNYIAKNLASEAAQTAGRTVLQEAQRYTLKGLFKEVMEEFGEEGTEKIMEQGFAIAGTELKNKLGFSVGANIPFVSPEAALLIGLRRSGKYGAYFNGKQEFSNMLAGLSPAQQELVAQVLGEEVKLGTNTTREKNTVTSEIIDPELSKGLVGAPRLVKASEAGRALFNDENASLAKNLSGTVLEYEGNNLAGETKVIYRLWSEDSWKILGELSASNIQALTIFSENTDQPHIINIPLKTNCNPLQRDEFLRTLYEEQSHSIRGKDRTASHEFMAKLYAEGTLKILKDKEAKLKAQVSEFKARSAEEILTDIINNYQDNPEEISQAVATYLSIVPDADQSFGILPWQIIPFENAETQGRESIFSDNVAAAKKRRGSDIDHAEQRQKFFQRLLVNLKANLKTFAKNHPNLDLRSNQLGAIDKLIDFLEQNGYGGNNGFFRQPTGAGKTVLMGIVAKLLDVPTIILAPKVDLLDQTKYELIEMLGYSEEDIGMVGNGHLELGRKVTIVTYASHVSKMSAKNKDKTYIEHVSKCELVFCDEAHRSLGGKTTEAIGELDYDLEEDLEAALEEGLRAEGLTGEDATSEEEVFSGLSKYVAEGALILGVTATPKLALKHVKAYFRHEIHSTTYTEMVKDKVNVPFEITEVEAEIMPWDVDSLSEEEEIKILEREEIYLKELRAFADLLEKNLKAKKSKKSVPIRGLGFCVNIAECDKFLEAADIVNAELKEDGRSVRIKPEIVTSRECQQGQVGLQQRKEAENRLRNQESNIIVTVNKLAEGWNFKEANCALWARATRSVMLLVQGIGRIARSYQSETEGVKDKAHVIQAKWKYADNKGKGTPVGPVPPGPVIPPGPVPPGPVIPPGPGPGPKTKREKRKPLTLQAALALMGEDVFSICKMADGSEIEVQGKYYQTWDEGIAEVAKFKKDNGRLPTKRDGSIGNWLGNQKNTWKNGQLSAEQIKQLEALGVEKPKDKAEIERTWDEGITELAKFKKDNGRLPTRSDGSIEGWLGNQKKRWKNGQLSAKQIEQLEALGVEKPKDLRTWDERIVEVTKFKKDNRRLPTPREGSFGLWLHTQKQRWKNGQLSAKQIEQLEALGVEKPKDLRTWDERITEVIKFKKDNGRLPTKSDGSIGGWLDNQKQKWKKGELSAEQIQRLEALGVEQVKDQKTWDEGIAEVAKFKKDNGRLPTQRDGSIGRWLSFRRQQWKKGELNASQIEQLKALGVEKPKDVAAIVESVKKS